MTKRTFCKLEHVEGDYEILKEGKDTVRVVAVGDDPKKEWFRAFTQQVLERRVEGGDEDAVGDEGRDLTGMVYKRVCQLKRDPDTYFFLVLLRDETARVVSIPAVGQGEKVATEDIVEGSIREIDFLTPRERRELGLSLDILKQLAKKKGSTSKLLAGSKSQSSVKGSAKGGAAVAEKDAEDEEKPKGAEAAQAPARFSDEEPEDEDEEPEDEDEVEDEVEDEEDADGSAKHSGKKVAAKVH